MLSYLKANKHANNFKVVTNQEILSDKSSDDSTKFQRSVGEVPEQFNAFVTAHKQKIQDYITPELTTPKPIQKPFNPPIQSLVIKSKVHASDEKD
jgi:hypothetical protein